ENKLDQALGDCQKAVRLENQEPEVFAVLAEIYVKLCEYQRAIEEYSRAVEIAGPDHSKAHYLYHRGATFYQLNDFENARKDFKEACRLRPNHSGSWIWQAASSARLEKWSSAIVGLQQAIASRPSATEQYLKLGQPVAEKAIVFFDRQQQRKQDTVETYRQRGLAYQFLEQNQDAIKDFTTALNQDQDHQATLVRRGQAYAEVGEHDLAVKDFTRVIKLNPDNHEARYHRAISRTWQKKFDEGRSDLIKAIKVAPNDPKYYLQLAEIMQKVGDQDKMMEYANKAVMQDPTDPNSYSKRGHAQMICGNHLNAVSDFTHSLELNPSQLDVVVSRGQAYLKAEFPKLAIKDFELALTHDERLVKAYSGRANAMVIEGKMEQALIWLTKAIHRFETPRQLSEILFARGKAFYQMGRFAPAASDFTAVIDLMRSDTKTVAAARFARALTNIQSGKLEKVQKDFRRLLKLSPNDKRLQESLTWIEHPDPAAKPKLFEEKIEPVRPTRPTVKRAAVELAESQAKWQNDPPYDSWIVRNEEKKEYGPVRFNILKTWISDGRVDIGMRVLRSDWSKWKRAEKIFPELSPVGSGQSEVIEEFPELDIRKKSAEPN
ncbi:MAG: tetratricopeptide repeat protein, partial [Planctomycetota bacterium]